jgi:hypothetical protein
LYASFDASAAEVLEHRKAALQQVRAERARLDVIQHPEARLPHECDRIPEQIGIVECQDAAAVGPDVEKRELADDLGSRCRDERDGGSDTQRTNRTDHGVIMLN